MKAFVVLLLALSASAVPTKEGFSRTIRSAKANVGDDPTDDCGKLISTLDSSAFQECGDIGFKFVDGTFSYTDAEVSTFCTSKCADLLVDTVTQLIAKCNMPDEETTTLSPLWHAACVTNLGVPCDSLWLQMRTSDYMECVQERSDAWPCPASCEKVLASLKDHLGCCYKSFSDVMIKNDPPFYFGEDLWTACKIKEPPSCIV